MTSLPFDVELERHRFTVAEYEQIPHDSIIDLLGAPPDVADIELETPKHDDVARAADLS